MEIERISELIKTQDNRFTDQPIFVVEKSVLIITDPDYGYDEKKWVNTGTAESEEASETTSRRLNSLHDSFRSTGDWEMFYLKETWAFVTSCFTEQGCKDYLAINGHNLGKTRIYAYGSYRNNEFRTVREMLINLEGDKDE